jgi:NAD-dependent dihydropyrimidine dehydrogenase PreA subunit
MIELVSEARCIKCDVCIRVCPTNVFEHGPDRLPVIAHQETCQTCFMCEAWCPTDALFVAPQDSPVPEGSPYLDEAWLIERGLLGSYRRELGWATGRDTVDIDGREMPDANNGISPLRVEALGLENRRAATGATVHDLAFEVAYSDEGEDVEDPATVFGTGAGGAR